MNEIQKAQLTSLSRIIQGAGKKVILPARLLNEILEAAEAEHIPSTIDELLAANKDRFETLIKEAKKAVAALSDNMG